MEFTSIDKEYTYTQLLEQKNSLLNDIVIVEKTMLDLLINSITSDFKNYGSVINTKDYELYINIETYDIVVQVNLDKVVFTYKKGTKSKKQNDKIPLKTSVLTLFSKSVIWYPERQTYDDFSKIHLTKILPTKSSKV